MIDVILPTYNHAEFIDRAISSLLAQSFQDFHLFVVNDASTDNTVEVLKKHEANPKITVLHHAINKGISGALNTGHAAGKALFCTWVSSDNISRPNHLEVLYNAIRVHQADLVFSAFNNIMRMPNDNSEFVMNLLEYDRPHPKIGVMGPSFLYYRSIWERFKYDEQYRMAQDFKFYAQVRITGHKVVYLSVPLIDYFVHPNCGTGRISAEKRGKDATDVIQELQLDNPETWVKIRQIKRV